MLILLQSFFHNGFNRYMVECKLFCCNYFQRIIHVLIDTWWNVNIGVPTFWIGNMSFNRYMVECK